MAERYISSLRMHTDSGRSDLPEAVSRACSSRSPPVTTCASALETFFFLVVFNPRSPSFPRFVVPNTSNTRPRREPARDGLEAHGGGGGPVEAVVEEREGKPCPGGTARGSRASRRWVLA